MTTNTSSGTAQHTRNSIGISIGSPSLHLTILSPARRAARLLPERLEYPETLNIQAVA